MVLQDRINVADEALAELCRRHHVRELALFGSVLRDDFRADSDIDMLVEFEPDARIGIFELARLQRELAALFGREVDLVPKAGLKPVIRKPILETAYILYS